MKGIEFPVFKTKTGNGKKFLLEDPAERRMYFALKAGPEIKKLQKYLKKNTFIGFLLGKKNSGKGTYSKLFKEAIGSDLVAHLSVGDIVRNVHGDLKTKAGKKALVDFLKRHYRGFISIEKALDVITGRDTLTLLPTEIILALVQREIDRIGRKAIFIDGFPRNLDQISYSLFFRAIMGYRDDPDFFVFIDLPETVMDERIKYRVICPHCHTPRNLRVLRTNSIGYDKKTRQFYLICDNRDCVGFNKTRLVSKEGDHLGIEAIRERIELDDKVMRTLLELQGVPKIYLRNSVPIIQAKKFIDNYEITPGYRYELDVDQVKVIKEPWEVIDDNGQPSYSLLPAPVGVSLIKQVAKVLDL